MGTNTNTNDLSFEQMLINSNKTESEDISQIQARVWGRLKSQNNENKKSRFKAYLTALAIFTFLALVVMIPLRLNSTNNSVVAQIDASINQIDQVSLDIDNLNQDLNNLNLIEISW